MMEFDIEYFEYDCAGYCTTNGCGGHMTDIPIGIIIDGVTFFVEGYEGGSFPGNDIEEIDKVISVVNQLKEIIL